MKKRQQRQNDQAENEGTRDKMAQRSGPVVLLYHGHFPVAVLQILAKQSPQAVPRSVGASNRRRVPNFSARQGQAQIELVVLIAQQRFVEMADAVKNFAAIKAAKNGICGTFVGYI